MLLKIIIHHNTKHVFLIPVFRKWWIKDPFHMGEKLIAKKSLNMVGLNQPKGPQLWNLEVGTRESKNKTSDQP